MEIRVAWCKRTSKCRYCGNQIDCGQPEIVGVLRMVKGKMLKFPVTYRWHFPECWIAEAKMYLDEHPYVTVKRKGRSRVLDPAIVPDRMRIMKNRASLKQRLSRVLDKCRNGGIIEDKDRADTIDLIGKLNAMKAKIEPYGEVPSKWYTDIDIEAVGKVLGI